MWSRPNCSLSPIAIAYMATTYGQHVWGHHTSRWQLAYASLCPSQPADGDGQRLHRCLKMPHALNSVQLDGDRLASAASMR